MSEIVPTGIVLATFYEAIFKEFWPETRGQRHTETYRAFVHVHHEHTPQILTLAAFNAHFEVVARALREHDFIGEWENTFPGRPHTSKYECEQNLKGLRCAIQELGAVRVAGKLDYIFDLHVDVPFERTPRNVRDPVDTDIMALVYAYRPRMALSNVSGNKQGRRAVSADDAADTDENKENAAPRAHSVQAAARPAAPRARMAVSELLNHLGAIRA